MSRHNPKRVRIWRGLIDAWKQSGQSVNAFCRDRKPTRSNFDRWRRILATGPGESAHGKPSSAAAFVPVRFVAEPMVEVVLRSGIVVRLPLAAAREAVTRLVAAVGRRHAEPAPRRPHGGLKTAVVMLSVCASATRHRLNPWSYLRDVLDQLATRSGGNDVGDLLPDTWASRYAQT